MMKSSATRPAVRQLGRGLAALLLSAAACASAYAGADTGRSAAASAPATAAASTANNALPGNSLYQLDISLTDASNQRFSLRDMAGTPVLVTMFYGDCNAACPIIIETLKRTVEALGPNASKLRVLMVSLDPFNDSPAGLAQLVKNKQLDPQRFRLAVAKDESQTRMLAGALQIKFRQLGDGVINHTTRVALLDGSGLTKAVSTRLDTTPDAEFVKQINSLLKTVKN
ncbi:SCO family protein [Pseudoduganella danionis]|uniref:SCO family protein n=1 Tax=Pseudoduganella danionis TaxID=1890295 RepID=UPI0035B4F83C